jgi:hypothetical protein
MMFESNRLFLIQEMHDQFAFDHSKINKTIKLLQKNHRWSEMTRDVKQYIRNCHICKRIKATKNKYQKLLNSLSIFNKSWMNRIFDFVTKLFDSRKYNAVLIIIDRLSKMHYYISCTIDENEIRSKKRSSFLFNMSENYMNCSSRWFLIKNLNLYCSYETRFVKCLKLKRNYSQHFIRKWMSKMKFSIKKWNDIYVFTLIISKTTESIDYRWLSTF